MRFRQKSKILHHYLNFLCFSRRKWFVSTRVSTGGVISVEQERSKRSHLHNIRVSSLKRLPCSSGRQAHLSFLLLSSSLQLDLLFSSAEFFNAFMSKCKGPRL